MLTQFKTKTFVFQDRQAHIVYPSCPANGKLLLKTEYFTAFPYFEVAMLKKGYTLCFLSHPNRWATDSETHITAEFVQYVAKELGFAPKCIPVGMSCGGLQALRLAQLHPELISVLYIDAPVVNILSLAGLGASTCPDNPLFWEEIQAAHGVTRSTIVNFRKSPIDAMDKLIEHNIPIIMLYGDADTVVLYEENGKVLEDYYRENGGDLKVIRKPGCGHHPHSLEDPTPIIEFVETHL
jgi:pimeloyl-ACP methyl ester carboxylesterase